jgi:phosphatidylglycerol---prolipoprotein diacylglyceryl transferase
MSCLPEGLTSVPIHLVFDLLSSVLAFAATLLTYRFAPKGTFAVVNAAVGPGYVVALVLGAVCGGYGFGTLNLAVSGVPGLGRSTLGALAGAIAGVEGFKAVRGIKRSTGLIFVIGFSTSIAVGRIGCFLAGMEDHTHGTATTLPWGHDFGDGVLRHPVQLYEAASMAMFLGYALFAIARRDTAFAAWGFYLMVGFYAAQRFLWEFLKPYGTVAGPFNLFHLLCLALICYSGFMISRIADADA